MYAGHAELPTLEIQEVYECRTPAGGGDTACMVGVGFTEQQTSHQLCVQLNMASKAIKFAPALKELRIHLCQKSEASKGVRDFIEKYYVGIKQQNPKFPILIRECSGVQPRLWARYEGGRESSIPLTQLKAEDVLKNVSLMAQNA
ncbi:NADH dehydrogenase [ubiquinone] 1 alpha subcomplex subunit 2 [Frankliniella fusca]|uniref:NADH dehydrogenase [ubiquinone] 1 alpha subcomplex subunit 2 n=1 Tax=Frankliniella fusca TaxID=407009 RepID=A0AAE1L791_9NEOP|nr:NADH dehydrogenase [ubiquinone] 1 alpha subcomplex subunit 2 [Frankliniella fusca]